MQIAHSGGLISRRPGWEINSASGRHLDGKMSVYGDSAEFERGVMLNMLMKDKDIDSMIFFCMISGEWDSEFLKD